VIKTRFSFALPVIILPFGGQYAAFRQLPIK
jgi:hypothetical protein